MASLTVALHDPDRVETQVIYENTRREAGVIQFYCGDQKVSIFTTRDAAEAMAEAFQVAMEPDPEAGLIPIPDGYAEA